MNIQRILVSPNGDLFNESDFKNSDGFHKKFIELLESQHETESQLDNGKHNCKEIIENLWSNLNQDSETENIVMLLRAFDDVIPRIFSDVVVNQLGGYGISENNQKMNKQKLDESIKKFTIFWKQSSHITDYRPFKEPSK